MSSLTKSDIDSMLRFVDCAIRGHARGAASGEKVVAKLAEALHEIGDDLALVDDELIHGGYVLMRLMGGPWPTDEDKNYIFKQVRRAAGAKAARADAYYE